MLVQKLFERVNEGNEPLTSVLFVINFNHMLYTLKYTNAISVEILLGNDSLTDAVRDFSPFAELRQARPDDWQMFILVFSKLFEVVCDKVHKLEEYDDETDEDVEEILIQFNPNNEEDCTAILSILAMLHWWHEFSGLEVLESIEVNDTCPTDSLFCKLGEQLPEPIRDRIFTTWL